jgi:general secretion pathway protein L
MTVLMLIIALPHSANATTGYAHVHSDGHSVLRHATGPAATLSAHAGEIVAVVPHSRLSWLRVQLPPASQGPRLPSVLHGLLEDRLLDEPQQLHLVPAPQAQEIARTGGETLVAVCDKQWLRDTLAPLQAAGLTVQRIVPELSPNTSPALYVLGEPDHAQSVLCHAHGVTMLPPNTAQWHAFAELDPAHLKIQAEPAMVARVQSTLQRQPMMQSAAQRWVESSQSAWDLAQGEWAQGRVQRWQRQARAALQTLLHAPAWKPVRWGLVTLVILQVLGLNVLAWQTRSSLNAQQASLQTILKTTFPSVTLVIDAPLQMQREVDALQQKSGGVGSTDFEPLLDALSAVLPAGQTPAQIHFANQSLRVQGVSLNNNAAGMARLKALGLRLHQDGNDTWVLQRMEGTP